MANSNSLSFNGSSQYATRANSIIGITSDWTVEFWMKLNAEISSGIYEPIHFENNTSKHVVYIRYEYNSGTRRLYVQKDRWVIVGATMSYNTTLGTANWNHIAITHTGSGGAMEMFLNGSSVATCASSDNSNGNTTTNDKVRIGAANNVGTDTILNYANVKLDEIRFWSAKRTSTQINDNMNKELVGNESGLAAYWKLNNDYEDATANNYDLTASNSPTFSTDVPFIGAIPTLALMGVGM